MYEQVRGARPHLTTGVIHAADPAALSHWLKSISDNIVGLTNLQVTLPCSHYFRFLVASTHFKDLFSLIVSLSFRPA